uniref:Putative ovule protein n=1 Tax=Solanum chacoense TaxID=4108 RepID=A0A0V0H167_SOLCH
MHAYWFQRKVFSSFTLQGSGFLLVDDDDLEFHREFLSRENSQISVTSYGVKWRWTDSYIKPNEVYWRW